MPKYPFVDFVVVVVFTQTQTQTQRERWCKRMVCFSLTRIGDENQHRCRIVDPEGVVRRSKGGGWMCRKWAERPMPRDLVNHTTEEWEVDGCSSSSSSSSTYFFLHLQKTFGRNPSQTKPPMLQSLLEYYSSCFLLIQTLGKLFVQDFGSHHQLFAISSTDLDMVFCGLPWLLPLLLSSTNLHIAFLWTIIASSSSSSIDLHIVFYVLA